MVATLYRESEQANVADADFEACLQTQFSSQNSKNGVIAGAVIGGVLGALALFGLVVCAVKCCKQRRASAHPDVELPVVSPEAAA